MNAQELYSSMLQNMQQGAGVNQYLSAQQNMPDGGPQIDPSALQSEMYGPPRPGRWPTRRYVGGYAHIDYAHIFDFSKDYTPPEPPSIFKAWIDAAAREDPPIVIPPRDKSWLLLAAPLAAGLLYSVIYFLVNSI